MAQAEHPRVEAELVRLVYSQAVPGTIAGLLLSAAMWAVLWDAVPHGPLSALFSAVILANLVRLELVRRFRAAPVAEPPSEIARWRRAYVVSITAVGLVAGVGCAVILWFLQSVESQLLMFAVLAGVAAANLVTSVSVPSAFGGFQIALLTPNVLFFLTRDDNTLVITGLLLALLAIILWACARRFHGTLRRAVTLSHANVDLLEDLVSAKDRAEAATRAKSAFLANVSHEIRTPMTAVVGLASVLRQSGLGRREIEMVERIQGASDVLLGLIGDMLDFSRVEHGRLALEVRGVSLRTLLDGVVRLVGPVAREKDIELTVHVAPSVPRWIAVDPRRLHQVLVNLAGNAVKFTAAGHVDVRLGIQDDSKLRVEVEDTGPGMSELEQVTVFEPFVQLDEGTTRRHAGTGLGLAISRELTRLMGGEIGVVSAPGAGSTFWVELPCRPVDGDEPGPGVRRALLIEPLERTRAALEAALAADGVDVVAVAEVAGRPKGAFELVLAPAGLEVPGEATVHYERPVEFGRLYGRIRSACGADIGTVEKSPSPAPGARVLLVDDNPTCQVVGAEMLHALDCRVTTASSGAEALAALSADTYDLVLLDCHMPGKDGYEVAAEIRRREPGDERTAIVALTGSVLPDEPERCRRAGMDGYSAKPVDLAQLSGLLERWVAPVSPGSPVSPASSSERATPSTTTRAETS